MIGMRGEFVRKKLKLLFMKNKKCRCCCLWCRYAKECAAELNVD